VALAYARDRDGALAAVAALDPAARRARAPFRCPGCGDEVTPRLGAVRARHFAHRPGARCPLTAPETALHFNAKQRLLALCAEAFAGARAVALGTRCPACRRPDPRPLAGLGDAAAAEGAVGALRADVLVTRRGRPALALEVLVTHAVDGAKEAVLAAAAVPMIEIDAREEWERELATTTGAGSGSRSGSGPESGSGSRSGSRSGSGSGSVQGSPVELTVHRALGFPPCPACQAQARAEAGRAEGGEAAEIAELEAYRARGLLPATSHGPRRGGEAELSDREVAAITARFSCPDCGRDTLLRGARLLRHPCPGHGDRPVAWRGYDGRVTGLGWWKR